MPTKKKSSAGKQYRIRVDYGMDKDGNRLRKNFYGKTEEEAKRRAEEFKATLKDDPMLEKYNMFVYVWAQKWFETYAVSCKEITRQGYREIINTRIIPAIGHMPMKDVRHIDIAKLYNSLTGSSKSMIQKVTFLINAIFRTAVENDIINKNPALNHKKPVGTAGERRALTDEETAAVKQNWVEHYSFQWAMIMMLAGLRPSEMVGLNIGDIDLESNCIHIRRSAQLLNSGTIINKDVGKTKKSIRDIPIFPELRPVVETIRGSRDAPACTGAKGGRITKSSLRKGWTQFRARMNNILYPDGSSQFYCTPDDMRHTFATMLHDADVDIKTAAELMGHDDTYITMLYTHLSKRKKSESLEKLNMFIQERFKSSPHVSPHVSPHHTPIVAENPENQ